MLDLYSFNVYLDVQPGFLNQSVRQQSHHVQHGRKNNVAQATVPTNTNVRFSNVPNMSRSLNKRSLIKARVLCNLFMRWRVGIEFQIKVLMLKMQFSRYTFELYIQMHTLKKSTFKLYIQSFCRNFCLSYKFMFIFKSYFPKSSSPHYSDLISPKVVAHIPYNTCHAFVIVRHFLSIMA